MSVPQPETGRVSVINSVDPLAGVPFRADGGTVVSATASAVVLAASASAVDGTYDDLVIQIVAGTGRGQFRLVSAYVGGTRTATVSAPWDIVPDATSAYVVHRHSGQVEASTFNTVTLSAATAVAADGYYTSAVLVHVGPEGSQTRVVTVYTGATRVAEVGLRWETLPLPTDLYFIAGESGTAAAATSNEVTLDANAEGTDDFYNDMYIEIYEGPGAGQIRRIADYDGATRIATVAPSWYDGDPAAGSLYTIFGGWGATVYEDTIPYAQGAAFVSVDGNAGELASVVVQWAPTADGVGNETHLHRIGQGFPMTHTAVLRAKYYRVKLVGLGTPLFGAVQTTYHEYKSQSTSISLEEPVIGDEDAGLVRGVTVGQTQGGQYLNARVSGEGNLQTVVYEPSAGFGSVLTAQETQLADLSFVYGINQQNVLTQTGAGFYVEVLTEGGAMAVLEQRLTFAPASVLPAAGDGAYFDLFSANDATQYYVWFNVDGGNADPTPGGTAIPVAVAAADSAAAVAAAVNTAVDAEADFDVTLVSLNRITVETVANGATTSARRGTMPGGDGGGGSVTVSDSVAQVATAAAVSDTAVLRSRRVLRYHAGLSNSARFTAIFGEPEPGVAQLAGCANPVSAMYFGYDGSAGGEFGILRRRTGLPEVRTLTLSAGAGGAETASVTLDGVEFQVAVTAGTTQHNAYELSTAAANVSYAVGRWQAFAVGSTVVFYSMVPGARTLTFALASTGTLAGTFARTTEGTATADVFTPQSEWNTDRCNGEGPSRYFLVPQTGNVFRVVWQWLGFGGIRYYVEEPITSRWILVHRDRYTGTSTVPSLQIPHMRLQWTVENFGTDTARTVGTASGGGFLEGVDFRLGAKYSAFFQGTTTTAAPLVVAAIKIADIFNGLPTMAELHVQTITVANTTAAPAVVFLYLNSTLNETNFVYVDEGESAALIDSTATTRSGGSLIKTIVLAPSEGQTIDVQQLTINPGDVLLATIQRLSATDVTIGMAFTWAEDQ